MKYVMPWILSFLSLFSAWSSEYDKAQYYILASIFLIIVTDRNLAQGRRNGKYEP